MVRTKKNTPKTDKNQAPTKNGSKGEGRRFETNLPPPRIPTIWRGGYLSTCPQHCWGVTTNPWYALWDPRETGHRHQDSARGNGQRNLTGPRLSRSGLTGKRGMPGLGLMQVPGGRRPIPEGGGGPTQCGEECEGPEGQPGAARSAAEEGSGEAAAGATPPTGASGGGGRRLAGEGSAGRPPWAALEGVTTRHSLPITHRV